MLNDNIFLYFYSFAHQSFFLDWLIVFVAHTFPYLVILIAGVYLLFHHDIIKSKNPFTAFALKWKEIVLVFFSGIFAWVIANLIKIIIQIPRPMFQLEDIHPLIEKTGYSFPSGHATFYMALAVAIFLSHKKAGWWFVIIALFIGLGRIMAGVHFLIDILGGYVIGIGIAYFTRYFYDKIFKK